MLSKYIVLWFLIESRSVTTHKYRNHIKKKTNPCEADRMLASGIYKGRLVGALTATRIHRELVDLPWGLTQAVEQRLGQMIL